MNKQNHCCRVRSQFSVVNHLRVAALLSAAVAPPTFAQVQPSTVPTRDELDPFEKSAPPPSQLRLSVDGDIERAPCVLDDPTYANIKVTVRTATFNNLGPVSAEALTPAYERFLGSEQPISVICEIRDAAATLLRSKGYIAAVQVPTQKIEDGAVRFEVLYAKVTSIRVLGEPGRNERLLESYLKNLADGQVFNRFAAERYLLLARDVPGYDVRLSLKPAGTGAGDMIGEVKLRHTPISADLNVQNYASASTGRIGGQLRVQLNGLTGLGDRTILSAYTTGDFKEQQIYQLGHEMAVGGSGLRVGGRFTYALTRPSLGPTFQNLHARTLFANAEASYPLVRSQALTLRAAAGFDFVNQKVRLAGAALSEDRLRVGYLRLDGEAVDVSGIGPAGSSGWKLSGSAEVRKGLSLFDASPNCIKARAICAPATFVSPSLPGGDPKATVFRLGLSVELRPVKAFTVVFSPRFQTSSDAVFAFEQFSTGNYTIGRSFDPGTIAGDHGAGFQTEVRLDNFRLSPTSKFSVQPYAFIDHAWVWRKGAGASNPFQLSSAGGGVRIGFANKSRLDLTLAVPTRTLQGETGRRDTRFLASFTTNILPWRLR
jgi:hemolysin activation/secretion protein